MGAYEQKLYIRRDDAGDVDSESQKQDEGIRRAGTNEAANGDMETVEETVDEKMEPAKAGYQLSKGV